MHESFTTFNYKKDSYVDMKFVHYMRKKVAKEYFTITAICCQ